MRPTSRSWIDRDSYSDKLQFDIEIIQNRKALSMRAGEYGARWARECKGNVLAMPSVREIMDGLSRDMDIMID